MKRFKMAMLALAVLDTGVALQFGGGCGRFWGDLLADQLFLRGID